jgi:hypothetical protein
MPTGDMWGPPPERATPLSPPAGTKGNKWRRRIDTTLRWMGGVFIVLIVVGLIEVPFHRSSSTSTSTIPLPTTAALPIAQAYQACAADGATVLTAIAAFKAAYPNLNPTESNLISGGPNAQFLQSWPHDPQFYSFSLVNGELFLQAGTSGFLTFVSPPGVRFQGPSSCTRIGL